MRMPLTMRLAAGFAVVALALVGCDGDEDDGAADSSPSASPAPEPDSPEPSSPSIAEPTELWPAPPDPMRLTRAAGLTPERREHLDYHVHAHLDVFVDGDPIVVPAGIGIDTENPGVKTFEGPGGTGYGGIEECRTPCISPLHTHDPDGILHTESAVDTPNTLGQFFVEWGVRLDDSCVGEYCAPDPIAFYLDGKRYAGDPRTIELADHLEIAIVIGTPPAEIPKTADFSRA